MAGDAPKSSPIYWTFARGLKVEVDSYALPIDGFVSFRDGDQDFVAVGEGTGRRIARMPTQCLRSSTAGWSFR